MIAEVVEKPSVITWGGHIISWKIDARVSKTSLAVLLCGVRTKTYGGKLLGKKL